MKLFSVGVIPLLFVIFISLAFEARANCRRGGCIPQASSLGFDSSFGQNIGIGQFGGFGINPFSNVGQFGGVFDPSGQFGGFGQSIGVGQGFGIGLNGVVNPSVGADAAVSLGGISEVGGVQGQGIGGFGLGQVGGVGVGGNDIGAVIHSRRSGQPIFLGNRWVEPVAVNDPTIRLADNNTVVVDPTTGQTLASFPGMLAIDSGQVVNGRRVMFPASQDSVRSLLSAYTRSNNPLSQSILRNYATFLPQFTQQLLSGGAVGGGAGPGTGPGTSPGTGVGDAGAPPPPVTGSGNGNGTGSHGNPGVVDTRPEGDAEASSWAKWKKRYDDAKDKFDKAKVNEQVASVTKEVEGAKYKAKVIRQNCASKGQPNQVKPMTLILFSSKDGEKDVSRVVVKSGHIDEAGEKEAIQKAWTLAKTKSSEDKELGATATPDDSNALVNGRALSEEARKTYEGYDDVQLRIRPVIKEGGEVDFVSKQVIKHADDTKDKRWADHERDKNLFCVTAGSKPPSTPTDSSSKPPTPTNGDEAAVRKILTQNCKGCHGGDSNAFKMNRQTGEVLDGYPKDRILKAVLGQLTDEGVRRMPLRGPLSESDVNALRAWAGRN